MDVNACGHSGKCGIRRKAASPSNQREMRVSTFANSRVCCSWVLKVPSALTHTCAIEINKFWYFFISCILKLGGMVIWRFEAPRALMVPRFVADGAAAALVSALSCLSEAAGLCRGGIVQFSNTEQDARCILIKAAAGPGRGGSCGSGGTAYPKFAPLF